MTHPTPPATMGAVSSAPSLRGHTPVSVLAASQAFGSEIRLRLMRHYLEHPGSAASAGRALGVAPETAFKNTQVLIELGVVNAAPDEDDRRARRYTVNLERYDQLVRALADYARHL